MSTALPHTRPVEQFEADPAVLRNKDKDDYASSGYDTGTESLTSSIAGYVFENGRKYHSYFGIGKNHMPIDEKEQARLDLHHEIMFALLKSSLFLAPVHNPTRILDIGTGTGIWAIEVAHNFPNAKIIGIDLSPIQPSWIPRNCAFQVDDAEQPWTFKENSFDFIHSRNLNMDISDWLKLLSHIYRCTAPGGYVELAELGGDLRSDDYTLGPTLKRAFDLVHHEAMPKIGRNPATAGALKRRLQDAGFVDVRVRSFKQPYGPWPKDDRLKQIGKMALLMMETGIDAYMLGACTRILGMPTAEVERICKESWSDCCNKNFHMYSMFHVAYGRKPE